MNAKLTLLAVALIAVLTVHPCIACDDPTGGDDRDISYEQPCVDCPAGPQGQRGEIGAAGRDGRNGRDGRDGITTIVTRSVCPGCLEERISMSDAVIAAIPTLVVDPGRRFATSIGAGWDMDKWGLGLGAAWRATDDLTLGVGISTNLSPSCDDEHSGCIEYYDRLEHFAGRLEARWQW